MDIRFGPDRFWTTGFEDQVKGCAGRRLHVQRECQSSTVAEVVFWDAIGHFMFQTFGSDVPLELIEAVISEAKGLIRSS
jgi:hypothetical protein